MTCIVLAAGYATRLYPLTKNFPKPLLEVNGKTILDWLLDDIQSTGKVDKYAVVSNHRYFAHFAEWAARKEYDVTVLDDGTTENENRLGAVIDIDFAVEALGLDDDIFVIAGDNVLDISFRGFLSFAEEKKTSCIMRYYEPQRERLLKSGVVLLGEGDRVISMQEKPMEPASNWCAPPFYIYKRDDVRKLKTAVASGCGTDAPGSLAAWMSENSVVNAYEMPGKRYDIGNIDSYETVKNTYAGIEKNKEKDMLKR